MDELAFLIQTGCVPSGSSLVGMDSADTIAEATRRMMVAQKILLFAIGRSTFYDGLPLLPDFVIVNPKARSRRLFGVLSFVLRPPSSKILVKVSCRKFDFVVGGENPAYLLTKSFLCIHLIC